jgi:hypothetical protein
MASPNSMLMLFASYLTFVYKIGPSLMKNRRAFSLGNVTRAYNLSQIIACSCAVVMFHKLGFTFEKALTCPSKLSHDKMIALWTIWYNCSFIRVAELFETVIYILRKKPEQASILHVYHHISSIFVTWFFLKYDASKFVGSHL